ncbi:Rossmann-like domain-containing protein [Desulfatibacillum aliphaticivorans]|uniref:Rossmann-like domain-containing protein n=1 Tax=Desulfatibacillum aliphaticivorans TaxID=218208 RepID=UPI00041D17F2|nr:DUF364 domain-containing protein [Desulfatibacillum aliphaticivorans]
MSELAKDILHAVRDQASIFSSIPEVRMVAMSLGYTFVELENDRMGICFTPRASSPSCTHYSRAGSLSKMGLLELAGLMISDNPLEKSVGIAAANVLSQIIMDREPDKFQFSDQDLMDIAPVGPLKAGMVGYIAPFVPMLLKRYRSLTIVDDNPEFNPGKQANGCLISRNITDLSNVDVLIITGSAAVVGDFDKILNAANSTRFIGIVGPSAGWLPGPAFDKGVHAVGGTKILNIDGARSAILEGGGFPHIKKFGLKYTLVNK